MTAECGADVRPADQPPKRLRKRYRRDVRVISDLDGRTAPARRARDLVARLQSDLGAGGGLSAAQTELVTRCALLSILAGDCEVKVLRNQPIDVHAYVALVNCQRRVLQALGLQRDPKIIDGSTNGRVADPVLAARLERVWPQYHEAETRRHYADLEREVIDALDDSAPPKSDDSVSPTREDPQP
jgi:hypothetical protein